MLVAVLAVLVTVTLPLAGPPAHPALRAPASAAPSLPQAALIGVFMWSGYMLVLLAL